MRATLGCVEAHLDAATDCTLDSAHAFVPLSAAVALASLSLSPPPHLSPASLSLVEQLPVETLFLRRVNSAERCAAAGTHVAGACCVRCGKTC
jgi:hypothetical protein